MQGMIAILEDDPGRIAVMAECLSALGVGGRARWFTAAPTMIDWLAGRMGELALVSLDHDLMMLPRPDGVLLDPGDGREVANFLAARQGVCPVIVHSSNELRASEMAATLRAAGWQVTRVFPRLGPDWIETQWIAQIRALLSLPAGRT
ncbi:MAG TPA: cyclic-phosphate processing receiver domain-containing protein [Phycisphaerae bacterium]|nr:cyclic-phosphate processing receiver domain-containing protein [Phycisphaerae bacterium]